MVGNRLCPTHPSETIMTSANQIIALDLDGTILRTNKTVSDRTRTVIDRKDGGAQILEELI